MCVCVCTSTRVFVRNLVHIVFLSSLQYNFLCSLSLFLLIRSFLNLNELNQTKTRLYWQNILVALQGDLLLPVEPHYLLSSLISAQLKCRDFYSLDVPFLPVYAFLYSVVHRFL